MSNHIKRPVKSGKIFTTLDGVQSSITEVTDKGYVREQLAPITDEGHCE